MNAFEKHRQSVIRARSSASVILMAVPAYLIFGVIDYFFANEFWTTFFMIRVCTGLVMGYCSYLITTSPKFSNRSVVPLCLIITLSLGLGLGYMTYKTGGLKSSYYAGMNWITLGSLAFWPLLKWERIALIATIYAPFAALEFLFDTHSVDIISFISLAFMFGTAALSSISNILSLRSHKEEFGLREQLENLVRDKEVVIAKKSTEVANLKTLAKQFSPAVINAIETRLISLEERQRKDVAIIFIDIAGSTERSSQLDQSNYQKAMDLFFDMAIKKLLERNITVANFMGDGLMAIANAPFPMADFERIAFEAAVEIVTETAQRQKIFKQHWRRDFHIRVGISSGFANVGFFPNSDFGVYTAIGETVNLASRLCSATESSTIATTQGILSASETSLKKCSVKRGGSINSLKGFSHQDMEYFIATPNFNVTAPNDTSLCPLCSNHLEARIDLGDCYLVKCRHCQYSDIETKEPSGSKAA